LFTSVASSREVAQSRERSAIPRHVIPKNLAAHGMERAHFFCAPFHAVRQPSLRSLQGSRLLPLEACAALYVSSVN